MLSLSLCRNIYLWFCLTSTLIVGLKTFVNLRCLLFSLGIPGFCGRWQFFFLFICFYYFSRRFLLYMAALTDPQGRRLYTIQVRYHSFDSVKDILLKFWTEQSSLGCCSFPPLYSEKDLHRSSSASGSLVQVTWEYNWVNKSIFPPK